MRLPPCLYRKVKSISGKLLRGHFPQGSTTWKGFWTETKSVGRGGSIFKKTEPASSRRMGFCEKLSEAIWIFHLAVFLSASLPVENRSWTPGKIRRPFSLISLIPATKSSLPFHDPTVSESMWSGFVLCRNSGKSSIAISIRRKQLQFNGFPRRNNDRPSFSSGRAKRRLLKARGKD